MTTALVGELLEASRRMSGGFRLASRMLLDEP
jgi:hypothetical protein